jgi:hypothetical protein
MTTDLADVLDIGAHAWHLTESSATLDVPTRRASLVFAAERTATDPAWFDPRVEAIVRARLVHASFSGEGALFDERWDRLVAAVPFGHRMAAAVDALMSPGGGRRG